MSEGIIDPKSISEMDLAGVKLEPDDVLILILSERNRPVFYILFEEWDAVIRFREDKRWLEDIFLHLVYKYANYKMDIPVIKIKPVDGKMYPPHIRLSLKKDKLQILNSFRYIRANSKKKIKELYDRCFVVTQFKDDDSPWRDLETEILAQGMSNAIRKR